MITVNRTRWSDDGFLDGLRRQGDPPADECLRQLGASGQNFSELFTFLRANDVQLPDGAPTPLADFFTSAVRPPCPDGQGLDRARLTRGEDVFMDRACCASLALLAMSLPAGYAAPNLAKVLVMSGDLENHPYTRLLGTLQMVVNVTSRDGFAHSGRAVITAAKLRLLHAGVRRLVRRGLPEYESAYGVPVNHEDMLGTIMGFSLLVIRGLQRLEVPLSPQQAEDYYYLWRTFALAMGVCPPGSPYSTALIPATLTEADEFYAAYARRHYRHARENPEGVELTRATLQMLAHLAAETPLRVFGATLVPRIYMQDLLDADGLVMRGVQPVTFHAATRWALFAVLRAWTALGRVLDREGGHNLHERIGERFLQGMITRTLRGEVEFLIPERLSDLHALTERVVRPHGERRRAARRLIDRGRVPDRRSGRDRRLRFRQTYWGLQPRGRA